MVYLVPAEVMEKKAIAWEDLPAPRLIENPVTGMAQALTAGQDVTLAFPAEKLAAWKAVFELAEEPPVLLTNFPETIVSPLWHSVPTLLQRRDFEATKLERRHEREGAMKKTTVVDPEDEATLRRRAGGSLKRSPVIDVATRHLEDRAPSSNSLEAGNEATDEDEA